MKDEIHITVVYPAYKDDSDLMLESVRAAKTAFSKYPRLRVSWVCADDVWCSVRDDAMAKFLETPNSMRLPTTYRRGPMILGGENLVGQCETFVKAAKETNADIIAKMDCDTQLFNADWIEEFADNKKALCGGAFDFGYGNHISVFGGCYLLRSSVLDSLLEDVKKYPAHHKAWEDHEVSSRIFRISGGDMDVLMRWRSGLADLFLSIPLREANDTLVGALRK